MDEAARKKNIAILDFVMTKLDLKNDAQLARELNTYPPVISRIRHGKLGVSSALLIRIHETTETSFKDLREMMASHAPAKVEVADPA